MNLRKTYDLKQVKVTTSILWLLNKAETRNAFFSSMDIYYNKDKLILHSLIIRGLVSGELYFAALCKLFQVERSFFKDLQSVLNYVEDKLSEVQTRINCSLNSTDAQFPDEISLIRQKIQQENYLELLLQQTEFQLAEHIQLIDSVMLLYLYGEDLVAAIPNILGKLCNYRPNCNDPKILLQIWFKSFTCLSIAHLNIKEKMLDLLPNIIMQQEDDTDPLKQYIDNIKFSDKLALIINYEAHYIQFNEKFLFDYSPNGQASREQIKQNFMSLLTVIRQSNMPRQLVDFKELMLVLNSTHMQITANVLINIDCLVLEFFCACERLANHGSRTFRTKSIDSSKSISNQSESLFSNSLQNDKYVSASPSSTHLTMRQNKLNLSSTDSAFGTYSNRRCVVELHNVEAALNITTTTGSTHDTTTTFTAAHNITTSTGPARLIGPIAKHTEPRSFPAQQHQDPIDDSNIDDAQDNSRMLKSDCIITDGELRNAFLSKSKTTSNIHQDLNNNNKTSWQEQQTRDRSQDKLISHSNDRRGTTDRMVSSESKPISSGPVAETRLRLNMKRKEIERNKIQQQQERARAQQLLSDQVFKEIMTRSGAENKQKLGCSDDENQISIKPRLPRRMTDVKKSKYRTEEGLSRSKSQDMGRIKYRDRRRRRGDSASDEGSANDDDGDNLSDMDSTGVSPRVIDQLRQEISRLTDEQARLSVQLSRNASGHRDSAAPVVPVSSSVAVSHPSTLSTASVISSSYVQATQVPSSLWSPLSTMPRHPPSHELYYNTVLQPQQTQKHHTMTSKSTNQQVDSAINDSPIESQQPLQKEQKQPLSLPIVSSATPLNAIDVNKDNICDKTTARVDTSLFFIELDTNDTNNNKARKVKTKPKLSSSGNPIIKADVCNGDANNSEADTSRSQSAGKETTSDSVVVKKPPVAFTVALDSHDFTANYNQDLINNKLTSLGQRRSKSQQKKHHAPQNNLNQRELDKEKWRLEKKQKHQEIFQAYLKRKQDKEQHNNSSSKGSNPKSGNNNVYQRSNSTKLNKRNMRAISAAPTINRAHNSLSTSPLSLNNNQNNIFHGNSEMPGRSTINASQQQPRSGPSTNPPMEKTVTSIPGTKLFVEPKVKSNRNVISNAMRHCCLAGKVNEPVLEHALQDLERNNQFDHFMILLRGGCQYRSFYGFEIETELLWKLSGIGPKKITTPMIDKFYKYNSGAKKFSEVTSTSHLSTVIDAIMIYNTLWKSNHVVGSLASNNPAVTTASETSSQADFNITSQ